MKTKFWMVYCPTKNPPSFRHETRGLAESEAERLAKQNPGEIFVVLEAISTVVVSNLVWNNLHYE